MLTNQPDKRPTRKVAAGGLSAAAVVVLVWVAGLVGLEMPQAVAAAIVALVGAAVAYLVRNRT